MTQDHPATTRAVLVLEDGTVFEGQSVGAPGLRTGEVCFNTSMSGYQEVMTDPSYARQIVTLTYPHIGNVGANAADDESRQVFASGMVLRDLPDRYSSWRAGEGWSDFLRRNGVVAIAGIDTRRLVTHLRDHGAQRGALGTGPDADAEALLVQAREFPGLTGQDLAGVVSTDAPYQWRQGTWRLDGGLPEETPDDQLPWRVVAMDFGMKRNIARLLVDHGCRVEVVPADTPARDILARDPDGVFLSNGPGDPEPVDYAVTAISELVATGVPVFGICLGHQLLCLAEGARSTKLKFGHRGGNHPVKHHASNRVEITAHNHGFAVDADSLPEQLEVTHRSLFDGCLEGVRHRHQPAFSVQYHPEASPGPHDSHYLFDEFVARMRNYRGQDG